MVAVPTAARSHSKAGPTALAASIEPVGEEAAASTVRRDRGILLHELAGQCVRSPAGVPP
ncbi:hypothetical protein [Bradyrhizobium sp. Leo170]|uniref:hypothetical protein n=1 Tax=Bradyrhizobium sp. Leo170 TaxID=1571199 RepID=UPI0013EEC476